MTSHTESAARQAHRRASLPLVRALLFFAVFLALQWAWSSARGTPIERVVIDHATVRTAQWLIGLVDPSLEVIASGSRLIASGGGINILNGCEGTEVLFMLLAALAASAMSWRMRLAGALWGTLLVFSLNQVRVLALFFAFRSDRQWFDLLHGLVAPLVLVALAMLFFLYWQESHGGTDDAAPAA